jgi:predicted PurR-regulated permease PerM
VAKFKKCGAFMKNRFNFTALFFFLLILFAGNSLYAVETAPRISDREIIESLAELKAGQKALKESMEARFEQVDKRFEQVDKRFEQVNSHFGQMYNLVLSLFGSLIVLIIAVLGYSIWDRRTVTQKVSGRVDKIEHELDIKNITGSRIERLIDALKDLSKKDHKLAEVLRSFNFL